MALVVKNTLANAGDIRDVFNIFLIFSINSLWENLIFNIYTVSHHLDLPEYD